MCTVVIVSSLKGRAHSKARLRTIVTWNALDSNWLETRYAPYLPPEPQVPCLSKCLVIKSHYDDLLMVSFFFPYFSYTCTHGRMWVYGREVATPPTFGNRELKQRRRRRQRERQKSNRFVLAKPQLCTCMTLFSTFLCRHYTTTTWKCLMSRLWRTWRQDKDFLDLSFPDLRYRVLEWNSRNRCQHLTK